MKHRITAGVLVKIAGSVTAAAALAVAILGLQSASATHGGGDFDDRVLDNARELFKDGKRIFRYDTFGDEDFWGGKLRLHEAIAGEDHGGVGLGLTPAEKANLVEFLKSL